MASWVSFEKENAVYVILYPVNTYSLHCKHINLKANNKDTGHRIDTEIHWSIGDVVVIFNQ